MLRTLKRKLIDKYAVGVDLLGDDSAWILIAVALGWFLTVGLRLTFPVLMPLIRTEFGFSYSYVGAFLTTLWAGFALAQFPGGLLGDRLGGQRILAGSIGIATLSLVGTILALNTVTFFLGIFMFGISSGLYATTRFTIVPEIYPERDATALGVTVAAGSLGSLLIPAAVGFVATVVGWRYGLIASLPFFTVVTASLWYVVPRTATVGTLPYSSVRELLGEISASIRRRPVVLDTTGMLLMFFVYQGFTGIYPSYLVTQKLLSEGLAALVFAVFFGAALLVQVTAGYTADVIGRRETLVGAVLFTLPGFLLLPVVGSLPVLVVVTLSASGIMAVWPVAISYILNALPTEVQGTSFGFLRSVYTLAGSMGPLVVGLFADSGVFDTAFYFLAGLMVVALGLFWHLPLLD